MTEKKQRLLGNIFLALLLVIVISGCGQKDEAQETEGKAENTAAATEANTEANTEATADASEPKKVSAAETDGKTVFDRNWDSLKNEWNKSMTSVNPDLGTLNDLEEKDSAYGLLRTGTINENQTIVVSAATDNDTGNLRTAAIFGIMDDSGDVTSAAVNLVNIADSTISAEKKQEINTALGLVDGRIIDSGQSTYEENGLMYTAIYDAPENLEPTLGLSIQEVE